MDQDDFDMGQQVGADDDSDTDLPLEEEGGDELPEEEPPLAHEDEEGDL